MNRDLAVAARRKTNASASLPLLLIVALVAGLMAAVGPAGPAMAQSAPAAGVYMPLTSARIFNTQAGGGGVVAAQTTRDVQVAGLGGVPTTDVLAVVVDLTVFNNNSGSWGILWQAGIERPKPASSINYVPGRNVTNTVTTKLGTGNAVGKVSFFTWEATDMLIDVVGYYRTAPGGGGYVPLTQTRILDTAGAKIAANTSFDRKLRGVAGVPDSSAVTAVVVNATVYNETAGGYLTFWPRGLARPVTSAMSFPPARAHTNMVVATLSSDGWTSVFTSDSVDLILDVVGYYTTGSNATFVPLTPTRIIDTRHNGTRYNNNPNWGIGPITAPLAPSSTTAIKVTGTGTGGVPEGGVSTVILNVVADAATTATSSQVGFLTIWANGDTQPGTVSMTYYGTESTTNLVMAKVGTDGKVNVHNYYASTELLVDVVGYFTTGQPLASRNGPVVSDDGMYVAFSSAASDLVGETDTNGVADIFLFDRDAGRNTRVSASTTGGQANGPSKSVSISQSTISTDPDSISLDPTYPPPSNPGRVAFESAATNLISGDLNGASDVFVRDVFARTTTLASVSTSGQQGNAFSYGSAISANGRFVVFSSAATNLVANDANGVVDVFVRDLDSRTTERVSIATSGTEADAGSTDPAISADGRFVAFSSIATTLAAGDSNGNSDVFIRDRTAGTTTRLSVSSSGSQGNGASTSPSISSDGRYVAFSSSASNLLAADVDTNMADDVFLRDRTEGTTARMSVAPSGAPANGPSVSPSVSPDGRFVAFESTATNLVNADSNEVSDIFEVDLVKGTTSRLSGDDGGTGQGDGSSFRPSVSADGRFAAFESYASNFRDAHSGALDVFVHVWTDLRPAGSSLSVAASGSTSPSPDSPVCATPSSGPTTAMQTAEATDPTTEPHVSCVLAPASQSATSAAQSTAADAPLTQEDLDCEDGAVNSTGKYPVNIRIDGLSDAEKRLANEYAWKSNSWLDKAQKLKGGPIEIKGTKGDLRKSANTAVDQERAARQTAGKPFVNQAGHVPDTAVTGQGVPPCGWLDQGPSNQRAGGVLGSRVGSFITHYLVGGRLPVSPTVFVP